MCNTFEGFAHRRHETVDHAWGVGGLPNSNSNSHSNSNSNSADGKANGNDYIV